MSSGDEGDNFSWDYENLQNLKNAYPEDGPYRAMWDKYDNFNTGIDIRSDRFR